ncbi:kinase-like domain-containing protein [Cytidiella melzeri]|nr:kinase-like domain-containing protein [Cytidiella melzeri]
MRRLLGTATAYKSADEITLLIAWEEDGRMFMLDGLNPGYDLEKVEAPLPIPEEHLAVPWLKSYYEAPQPLPDDSYVKSLSPLQYEPTVPTLLVDLMQREIDVYTYLSHSPHPNLCPFYGCVRTGSYATALVMKRIPNGLPSDWRYTDHPVPKLSLLRGVKRGLDHLHSLGFVHNDISVSNIRLDESFRPVIIDFNATLGEGEPKVECQGTPGWFRESNRSVRENDFFSLGLIAKWLDGWEHDPFVDFKPEEPSSWTEDYLAPKILAGCSTSKSYNTMLTRAFYFGAHLTVLGCDFQSHPLGILPHHVNNRLHFPHAHFRDDYAQAWTTACSGLRSGEVDIAFFPISSDIMRNMSEHVQRLRTMLETIPDNLRPRRMQPRLVLFATDFDLTGWKEFPAFELSLRSLTQECLADSLKEERTADKLTVIRLPDLFENFVLVQRGGWLHRNKFCVKLWQNSAAASPSFSTISHRISADKLVDFILEPPIEELDSSRQGWGGTFRTIGGCFRCNHPALLTFTVASAALAFYALHKLNPL